MKKKKNYIVGEQNLYGQVNGHGATVAEIAKQYNLFIFDGIL